jgi:putative hydrolase of the HAD superfamily
MVAASFSHVDTWVFDLDNTLYPPSDQLFAQIEERMRNYMIRELAVNAAEADRLRRHYWQVYGTTLVGLMAEHDVDPAPFLHDVHDIDMSHMQADQPLRSAILSLPGRRIVYTNGSRPYAHRVLAARGLDGVFDAVYGLEQADYLPKPAQAAFETIFALDGITPARGAMFEDDARNLAAPHAMGMRTVHVAPEPQAHPYVHHHTADLAGFLSQLGR